MRKSKEYLEDEYKDTTKFKDEEETINNMTEDKLVAEDEDKLVAEDEDGELMVEDKHVADEHMAENKDDDNKTRPEVPIQHSKRGT
jgi:hypothetical protein